MADKKLKVFQIVTGERDLIAAYTNIGALQLYCSTTEQSLFDFSDADEVLEIPESEWDERTIVMGDVWDEDAPVMTLRKYLSRVDGPDFISSTAY